MSYQKCFGKCNSSGVPNLMPNNSPKKLESKELLEWMRQWLFLGLEWVQKSSLSLGIGYRSLRTYQKHLHYWVSYSLTQKFTISAYSNTRFSGFKKFLNIFDQRMTRWPCNLLFGSGIEQQTPYPSSPSHVPTLIICIWNYFRFDGL